jgi:hypothetical protein
MKNKLITATACLTTFAFCASLAASTTAKTSPPPTSNPSTSPAAKTAPAVNAPRAVPLHGMISAVDQKAKTFTIAGKEKSRVFKITDKTVLTKAGKAATMKDVTANEEVRGSYWKAADGSLEAKTIKLGPMTEAEKAAAEKHSKKKGPKTEPSPAATP